MTNYLVTGGAGFIGSHLVRSLLGKDTHVRVLDNFNTGKIRHLHDMVDDIEFIEGDFTDSETVKKAVQNVDVIFHQGAVPSVPKSIKDPMTTHYVNVTGTLQLLHAAVKAGVRRFIYAASSSAYGNSDVLPKREDMPTSPLSPYAVSKYAAERYCKAFYEVYGLETVSLRYFNVFGPNQDPHSEYAAVIPRFILALLHNQPPLIYGDGKQSRDFTYIDNVVSANLLAAKAPKLQGEAVNIGSGERIDLVTLAKKTNELLGTDILPNFTSERAGDVMHSLADLRFAENLIGYRPIVSFSDGLKHTANGLKKEFMP